MAAYHLEFKLLCKINVEKALDASTLSESADKTEGHVGFTSVKFQTLWCVCRAVHCAAGHVVWPCGINCAAMRN